MTGLNNVTGYLAPAVLALVFVVVYYSLASVLVRMPDALRPMVSRYEPPSGASPAVAASLFEPGDLPRSIAAALVNMAAKRYIKIEQKGDLFSLIRLNNEGPSLLEPEEHALQRTLLDKYEYFDFDGPNPQLNDAVRAFHWALQNTGYVSQHVGTSLPAWIVSAAGVLLVLSQARLPRGSGRVLGYDLAWTFACFILTVRTVRGPIDKLLCRLPGGTAPQRPWTGADSKPFLFLSGTVAGIAFLALLTNSTTAIFTAGFMAVNAIFFHALQGPTSAGRKMSAQLGEYRNFLLEVEADPISRRNSAEQAPAQFDVRGAYALAFRLDVGWGEQFVTAIADLIEVADIRETFHRDGDPLR